MENSSFSTRARADRAQTRDGVILVLITWSDNVDLTVPYRDQARGVKTMDLVSRPAWGFGVRWGGKLSSLTIEQSP